ncbi:Protein CBG07227 [Caenorhabditis briggsae]|uniref:Protein CBG07227 n=1 Tax=Caenorhabditis briggsae TaxID=6238 RepID=A8X3F9_CAEBR|nr:Protein CBG07227 [Caenorhabditis briggsae]CAP27169.1 Protein CBG07227 [Caenorhabditis briggsae]
MSSQLMLGIVAGVQRGSVEDCSDIQVDNPSVKDLLIGSINRLMEKKMNAGDIQIAKTLEISCGSEQKEFFEWECKKYMTTKSFQEGTKGTYGQVICCDELKFCSGPFYTQIWFFAVCGGVALLLIGIIGIVVFLLCCRKKRIGGSSGGSMMKNLKNSTKKSMK